MSWANTTGRMRTRRRRRRTTESEGGGETGDERLARGETLVAATERGNETVADGNHTCYAVVYESQQEAAQKLLSGLTGPSSRLNSTGGFV